MDYSRLVESLRKEGTNRICFDCGVVGTTYASLNFGTFVCSQCAGILRGLNFKVKAFGISIFTLDEYEFLKKNGNNRARNIWLGAFNPYKDEKPNPKKYDQVKQHIIKKYKQKLYYKESKGIHFINKSIEEDIKDPLDFVNKCRVKNIDIGPSWARKANNTDEGFDFSNDNNNDKNKIISQNINNYNSSNKNLNAKKNVDFLDGLLNNDNETEKIQNNFQNNEKIDINNLLEGFNFNNNNSNNINNENKTNNITQNNNSQNIKNENNLGFDFSSFENNFTNNNNANNNTMQEKNEDTNLGFDFGEEDNQNKNSINKKENNNILDLNFNSSNNNQNLLFNDNNQMDSNQKLDDNFGFNFENKNNNKNDLGFNFDFSGKEEKGEKNLDFFNDNQNNKINKEQTLNNINDNLGFDFGEPKEDGNKMNDVNNTNNNNLGLDLDFNKDKKEEINDAPKNINSLFEDPNSEKINNMKKNQEIQRNNDFQSLTIALDNQNQLDQINQGNFDFSSITNNINQTNQAQTNNSKDQNVNFNFDNFMQPNK